MPSASSPQPQPPGHWPEVGHGVWTRWWGYLVRWLAFGLVVHLFQPVAEDGGVRWLEKLQQALMGLGFGFVCAVVFTVADNKFNVARQSWKTWTLIVLTWLLVKVVFVSALALWA